MVSPTMRSAEFQSDLRMPGGITTDSINRFENVWRIKWRAQCLVPIGLWAEIERWIEWSHDV